MAVCIFMGKFHRLPIALPLTVQIIFSISLLDIHPQFFLLTAFPCIHLPLCRLFSLPVFIFADKRYHKTCITAGKSRIFHNNGYFGGVIHIFLFFHAHIPDDRTIPQMCSDIIISRPPFPDAVLPDLLFPSFYHLRIVDTVQIGQMHISKFFYCFSQFR